MITIHQYCDFFCYRVHISRVDWLNSRVVCEQVSTVRVSGMISATESSAQFAINHERNVPTPDRFAMPSRTASTDVVDFRIVVLVAVKSPNLIVAVHLTTESASAVFSAMVR